MVVVIFSAQPWQMQLKSYTVAGGLPLYIRFFVHQIKDDTLDRSQRRKDYMYCTQQSGHHACCTCEVNGFVQIPYMRAVHMLHAHLPSRGRRGQPCC